MDNRDVDGVDDHSGADIDRGSGSTHHDHRCGTGYPYHWDGEGVDIDGSEKNNSDGCVRWKIEPAVYDVREAGGDRYVNRDIHVDAHNRDFGNVDADGEVDQTLVVAPPQKAVAVVAGDESAGVDIAGVRHAGVVSRRC